MSRPVIDGERKAVLRLVSPGTFRYEGLVTRSVWETLKPEAGMKLATMRALNGATLHVQSCAGQFPAVGTLIPAALLRNRSGQTRSGRQMDRHLTAIATQRTAEKQYARILQNARKVVL